MDEESKQMLREILDLQREQMKLLKAYLLPPWARIRLNGRQFSLRTLLIAVAIVAAACGLLAFVKQLIG